MLHLIHYDLLHLHDILLVGPTLHEDLEHVVRDTQDRHSRFI